MSREIKFRAYDVVDKTMIHHHDTCEGISEFWHTVALNACYEIMQFTGLWDKNGVDIYEGDIVITKGDDTPMVIGWKEYHASFCIDKKGWLSSHYFGEAFDGDQCEIIGNIYENSHLLKEDNEQ